MKYAIYRTLLPMMLVLLFTQICKADGAIVRLLTAKDQLVLDEFAARRSSAIESARTIADEKKLSILNATLAGTLRSFDDGYDPIGKWKCRYLKLGLTEEVVIYNWYSCKIFDDGAGWILKKESGSQRFVGRLYRLTHEQLLFLGSLHYAYEDPIAFGADIKRKQVAILTSLTDGRLRLEFPAPLSESTFDIVELAPIRAP